MTRGQFERQLKTWKRENKEIFNKILMLAHSNGILTKKNEISKAKKNEDKFKKFLSHYQNEIGSFSAYKDRILKARRKAKERLIKEGADEKEVNKYIGRNVYEYKQKMNNYTDVLNMLYASIKDSGDAHSYHMYAETMESTRDRIDYLISKM